MRPKPNGRSISHYSYVPTLSSKCSRSLTHLSTALHLTPHWPLKPSFSLKVSRSCFAKSRHPTAVYRITKE